MSLWQGGSKVRDGRALALMSTVFDLKSESVAGPAFLKGLPGIPVAHGDVFELLDKYDVMKPRQAEEDVGRQGRLCSRLLHNFELMRISGF